MKILIADDEQHIRNGLKMSLDYKKLKIDEILTAEDGAEAMEICRNEHPEIILTDIRMPGVDGLELAEKATHMYGAKKVLIMSGYSEFSYAQSAIRLGAVDYLLKPIRLGELEKTLANIVAEISSEDKKEELVYSSILKNMIAGRPADEDIRRKIAEKYEITGEAFLIIVKPVKDYAVLQPKNIKTEMLKAAESMKEAGFYLLMRDQESLILLWNAGDCLRRSAYKTLIKRALCSAFLTDCKWFAAVSMTGRMHELHRMYEQALKALDWHLLREKDRIIFYEDISAAAKSRTSSFSWTYIKEQISRLNMEDIRQMIAASFDELRKNQCTRRKEVQEFCITFKNLLLDVLKEKGVEIEGVMQKNEELFRSQLDYDVLSGYENWLKDCCYLILKDVLDTSGKQHSAVRKAIVYINKFYGQNITLAQIAADVQKSPNYFCYIFKKDTGMSFNEYLNYIRISKAKELLKTSDCMVYEIAEQVGYHDYTYFTKVFKKNCGCSPSEYRDNTDKS